MLKNNLWDLNYKIQQDDKPELMITNHGHKVWHVQGLRHRIGGPAVEYISGEKMWYQYGKLHREDGPAIEYPSGYKEYYINNIRFFSQDSWFKRLTPEKQYDYLWNLDE